MRPAVRAFHLLLAAGLLLPVTTPAAPQSATTGYRSNETARLRLHEKRLAILQGKYNGTTFFPVYRDAEERLIRQLASAPSARSPSVPVTPGRHLDAYFSKPDGSPQPFWTYVPHKPAKRPGLLLYLHGYNPEYDVLTAPCYPAVLTNFAETAGAYLAAPFGHGNTDFQHLGEADVFRVIEEMVARHGVDPDLVVLTGTSMGGLGAWCIASRWPGRFNAVIVDSGRADFYIWHRLQPDDIPPWQQEIVDSIFAGKHLPSLTNSFIIAGHGRLDEIVSYDQGKYPVERLLALGAKHVRFHPYSQGHVVFDELLAEKDVRDLLLRGLREKLPRGNRAPGSPALPGQTGFRLMDAFLSPFTLVAGREKNGNGYSDDQLADRALEWERFSKGEAETIPETLLTKDVTANRNLFFFGEPETSPAIRECLGKAGVTYTPRAFRLCGKNFPRDAKHGFILALPSPYNRDNTVIVQCGIPWGAASPDNHRFDRIPDLACYRKENDEFGYPIVDSAAFLTSSNTYRFVGTQPIRHPRQDTPAIESEKTR